MQAYYQLLVEQFSNQLSSAFNNYCQVYRVENNSKNFLLFLIDQNLLNESDIRSYTIAREFAAISDNSLLNKTKIVNQLSKKYNLSDRSVWTIIRRQGGKKPN